MEFINLTPHKLNLVANDGSQVSIDPSGTVARVSSSMKPTTVINGIQVFQPSYGEVENIPAAEDGKVFIVSRMVKDRIPERTDVLVPGNPVRDEAGNIIGSKGLCL